MAAVERICERCEHPFVPDPPGATMCRYCIEWLRNALTLPGEPEIPEQERAA